MPYSYEDDSQASHPNESGSSSEDDFDIQHMHYETDDASSTIPKRVHFSEQTQRSSHGLRSTSRSSGSRPLDGGYNDDYDEPEDFLPEQRDAKRHGTSATLEDTNRQGSADGSLVFNIQITEDHLRNFEYDSVRRMRTYANEHDDELFSRDLETRHIISSSRSVDRDDQEEIEVWHTNECPNDGFTHWRHINRQFMDLKEFEKLALQTPHVRDSDIMSILVKRFMEEIKKRFATSPRQGDRMLHGLLRCNAQTPPGYDSQDVAATWLCFPYLSAGGKYSTGVSVKESEGLNRTRTLFQWSYKNEPGLEYDESQAFKRRTRKLLYVPQAWVLILGKDTIVSSSPCPLKQLMQRKFNLKSTEPRPLQWIKLIDRHQQEIVFPATSCETFQALKISVAAACFAGKEEGQQQHELFVNDKRLTPKLWLYFTEIEKNPTLIVEVRRKKRESDDRGRFLKPTHNSNEVSPTDHKFLLPAPATEHAALRMPIPKSITESASTVKGSAKKSVVATPDDINAASRILAVHTPDMGFKTDEITSRAISRVRPFLEWSLPGKNLAANLLNQSAEENATTLYVLTKVHGIVSDPDYCFAGMEGAPNWLKLVYLEGGLYGKMPTATFEDVEALTARDQERLRKDPRPRANGLIPTSNSRIPGPLEEERPSYHRRQMTIQLVQSSKQLLRLFVSSLNGHPLLQKIWGAFQTLVDTTANPNWRHRYKLKQMENWIVLGSSDDIAEMKSFHDIPDPDRPHACWSCNRRREYQSKEEAMQHLVLEHYYKTFLESNDPSEALTLLVQSTKERKWLSEVNMAQCALIRVVLTHLDRLRGEFHDLKIGLAKSKGDVPISYTLPESMEDITKSLVGFILTSAQIASLIDSAYAVWVPDDSEENPSIEAYHYIDLVRNFGKHAESSIAKARKEIFDMISKDLPLLRGVHKSVGTHYMTSVILKDLLQQQIWDNNSTVDFYAEIFMGLQYSVYHDRPRRRMFSHIHLFQADVQAVLKVRRAQHFVLKNLHRTISPKAIPVSQCHISLSVVRSAMESALWDIKELGWLLKQSNDLEQRTRHRIEILEEDHGKAIFVFTLVTAVFLPLSFVSSYMGMNTADIRDTGATQERFWVVAIPITAVVMVVAIFLAYYGDVVKRWFSTRTWSSKKRPVRRETHVEDRIGRPEVEKPSRIRLRRPSSWARSKSNEGAGMRNGLPV